jgi:putative tryptophan/tyrosine transport system substrate-binding protein
MDGMKRRAFITLLGGAAAIWPFATRAQQDRRRRVGVLALSDADSIDALFDALRALGWIDGKTIDIVFPPPSPDPARLEENMRQLLAAKVDIVVAQTKLAIVIARRATDTLPIVMGALNGDPVREGFAQSLEHPGGNITGSYYNVAAGGAERLAVLTDLIPRLRHVGIVMNPDSAPSLTLADELAAAAAKAALAVTMFGVRGGHDVEPAFAAARMQGIAGMVAVTGAEMFAIRKEMVAAQDKFQIPAVMGSIGYAEMGGIAKLGPEIPGLWRRMAPAVDQLLRASAKPGDLPLVTLDGFELDINLRTAQAFGIVVPEALIRRATRVYR